jgi:diguanylate cyclase (GGDEF)-like protein
MVGLKKYLDIFMVILVTSLAYWKYLSPPIIDNHLPALDMGKYLVSSVSDLIVLCILILIIDRVIDRQNKASILLLVVGVIALMVTDSIFSYQSILGTYQVGGLLDAGRVLAYLMIGSAGMLHALSITSDGEGNRFGRWISEAGDQVIMLGPYMPYLWLVGAYVLLVGNVLSPLGSTATYLVAGIIGLSILRLLLAFIETSRMATSQLAILDQTRKELTELASQNREMYSQVVEQKRTADQASVDALHDWLTGLPNRALLTDRLGQVVEYSRQRPDYVFSVLALDIDQYKMISDSFGSTTADQLVVSVAQRLVECLRPSDTIAHLSHDEFVILLENTVGEDFVFVMVNRLREVMKPSFVVQENEIYATISIGAVMSLQDYNLSDEIMGDAEAAKNRAKAEGNSGFKIFDPMLRRQAFSRLELENDLRHALVNHEFQLYYQPIFTLYSNKVMGFEALIRWFHPKRGLINPVDFIPLAEECGLIIPIGDWVIEEACDQISRWHKKFPIRQNVSVNVNISGKQLVQSNFIEHLVAVLDKNNLKGSSLKFELTESSLIDNFEQANEVFKQLGELGVMLEIDDFGTGYSSLGYLQNFPFNTIKIDKSFIDKMSEGGKGTEIIRATILMAHQLGLETIAEGVETMEQLQELRNMTCHYVQGYLMSPPLDAISAEGYLVKASKTGRLESKDVFDSGPLRL